MVSKLLRHMKNYSSDITDSQWILLSGILSDNRKRKYPLRDIFNAIYYLLKIRCCQFSFIGSIIIYFPNQDFDPV